MNVFRLSAVIFFMILINSVSAQGLACERIVDYQIDAQLNPESKTVVGTEYLTWRNTTEVSAKELQFHAYLNAFKNNKSTFFLESWRGIARFPRKVEGLEQQDWGYLNVPTIVTVSASREVQSDLTSTFKYIQPDDDNKFDETVFSVTLPTAVPAGGSISLKIEFESKLPKDAPRTGFRDDYFLVAQWFPKIGVFDQNGEWNCHQFHTNSEFFADYGTYDVKLTVPEDFVVGATGILQDSTANSDGTTSYRFYADCVHDFVWTAYPEFVVLTKEFEHEDLSKVTMRLLLQPEHKHHADAFFDAAASCLKYYGLWYGAYPYPNITIIDPAWQTKTGGMEYPTFFTSGVHWREPKGTLDPHNLTIHECGHQWWYGLVGSNEFEYPWLDEGFNSYSDTRCLEVAYGPKVYKKVYLERGEVGIRVGFPQVEIQQRTRRLSKYRRFASVDKLNKNSWSFSRGESYGVNAYDKPSLMLWTLEGYLGEEIMGQIMKTYATRYRFKHPTPEDFIATVNEFAPENMDWFFEQVANGSGTLDYCVEKLSSRKLKSKYGYFDEEGGKKYHNANDATDESKMYETEVTVRRLGDVIIPVTVRIVFGDGEEFNESWDGTARWKKFRYTRSAPVDFAVVDPERKLLLDLNYTNNSMTLNGGSFAAVKWASKWLFWLQHFFEVVAFFS